MKRVVLSIGIPGAGKTTVLKALSSRHELAYVCPDDIRAELTGDAANHSQDRQVWDLARTRVAEALEAGRDVAVDATFTNPRTRREFLEYLRTLAPHQVLGLFFDVPLAIAKERNMLRTRVVSDEQLQMRQAHITQNPPALADGFDALYTVAQLAELEAQLG